MSGPVRAGKQITSCLNRAVLAIAAGVLAADAGAAALSSDSARRVPSSALDQSILEACEDHALPYGDYDVAVQSAVDALGRLGVFSPEDFEDATIGFCNLRDHGGPVATTSCEKNAILLDRKYERSDERLALVSTLAHEVKHYHQHREQKRRFGDGYCSSEQYQKDKAWMEREADVFGVNVARLAFTGRPIEIDNACPIGVDVYLDGEAVRFDSPAGAQTVAVPANTVKLANASSTSKRIQYFAVSEEKNGTRRYWRGNGGERIIDGARERLASVELEARARASGPFVLRLLCD